MIFLIVIAAYLILQPMKEQNGYTLHIDIVGETGRVCRLIALLRGNGIPEWQADLLPILDAEERVSAAAAPLRFPLDPMRVLYPPENILRGLNPAISAKWRRKFWGDNGGIAAKGDWSLTILEKGLMSAKLELRSPERPLYGLSAALCSVSDVSVKTEIYGNSGERVSFSLKRRQDMSPPAEEMVGPWLKRKGNGFVELRMWEIDHNRPWLAVVTGIVRVEPNSLSPAFYIDPERLGWRLAVRRLNGGEVLFDGSYASEKEACVAGEAITKFCARIASPKIPPEFSGGPFGRRRSHADFLLAGGNPSDLTPLDLLKAHEVLLADQKATKGNT